MTRGVGPIAAAGLDSKKVYYVIDLSPLCYQPIRDRHYEDGLSVARDLGIYKRFLRSAIFSFFFSSS